MRTVSIWRSTASWRDCDVVALRVRLALQEHAPQPPDYLERTSAEPPEGKVLRLPTRGDVDPRIGEIREQLIIEFCSR